MALPQQAIDQLSREPARTPGWSGRLLMFSSTLFFLSIFAYVGLAFGYERYLTSQASRLAAEVNTVSQQVSDADQADLLTFYSQLGNLETILASHPFASNIFGFLERNTHANVYFTRMEVNSETRKVTLQGVAKSVSDVTEQVQILERQSEVKLATFNNVTFLIGSGWQFDVAIDLQPNFFTEILFPSAAPAPAGAQAASSSATTTPVSAPR